MKDLTTLGSTDLAVRYCAPARRQRLCRAPVTLARCATRGTAATAMMLQAISMGIFDALHSLALAD